VNILIRCGCGQSYDLNGWLQLVRKGAETYAGARLELRDCICGSTLGAWCGPDWQPYDPQPSGDELDRILENETLDDPAHKEG